MKKSLSNDELQKLLEVSVEMLMNATNGEHCFVLMSLPCESRNKSGHLVANLRDENLFDAIEILKQELKVTYRERAVGLAESDTEH